MNLKNLREAILIRHPGRLGTDVVVQKIELAELLYHFDRLDREAREMDAEIKFLNQKNEQSEELLIRWKEWSELLEKSLSQLLDTPMDQRNSKHVIRIKKLWMR